MSNKTKFRKRRRAPVLRKSPLLFIAFMKPDGNGRPQFFRVPIPDVVVDEVSGTWSHPYGVTFGRAPRMPITKKIGEWSQVWPPGNPHPGAIGVCYVTAELEQINAMNRDSDEIRHASM
ncbi:MAG: hypothetical protein Q7R62_00905 [bacterium]|nr:hypothetical protein [bacterium]